MKRNRAVSAVSALYIYFDSIDKHLTPPSLWTGLRPRICLRLKPWGAAPNRASFPEIKEAKGFWQKPTQGE
jgi:hypothetical protein